MTGGGHLLSRAEGLVLGSLAVVFVCRCLAANAIVPPWQGPDEPVHFALAYHLTLPTTVRAEEVQRQVLESMAEHKWWELYRRQMPSPPPRKFADVEDLATGTLSQPLYYGLAADVLRVTGPPSLERAYSDLRGLSIVLSVLTLIFGWMGTRVLFGPDAAMGATAVAALSPQFLMTAITVNPDALLYVWSAFVWWQAARVVVEPRRSVSLLLLLIGAGAALLTKRIGLTSMAAAAVLLARSLPSVRPRDLIGVAFLVGVVIIVTASIVMNSFGMLNFLRNALVVTRVADAGDAVRYARLAIDYVWLAAGWGQFLPPEPWLWVARLLTAVGTAGAVLVYLKSAELRSRLQIAWLFVCVQVATVMVTVMWTVRTAPNGRYFLPALAPAAALFYLGAASLVPSRARAYFPVAFVAILAALDLTGMTTVLVPAYLQ